MEILIYKDYDNFPTGDKPKISSVFMDKDFLKKQKGEVKSFLTALSEINTETVAHISIDKDGTSWFTCTSVRFLITSTKAIDKNFLLICGLYHYDVSGNCVAGMDGVFSVNYKGDYSNHKKKNKRGWKTYFLKAFEKIRKEKEKEMTEIKKYIDSLTPV